jgi:hypothetical protein
LGLPRDPEGIARVVVAGEARRFDLLRTDSGSVTLHGSMLGGEQSWRGRVEVDDVVLSDGNEPLLGCSIRNAGSSDVDGLPLVSGASAQDGLLDVAVAVPVVRRRLLREAPVRIEVRRARGRAVSVTPRDDEVRLIDDGVSATLARKRAWWIERAAWALYGT